MAITASSPAREQLREHEKPMSWARAVVIAGGLLFATAILLGQIPSYFFTISTASEMQHQQQGFLTLGLLSIGLGALALELALLYDPKPIIPWPLFAGLGVVIAAIGAFMLLEITTGAWHMFLPDVTTTVHGANVTNTYWPTAGQYYLFNPIWFQAKSIDLASIGMLGLVIGLGMFSFAALNPLTLSGKLNGPIRDYTVRVCLAASIAIVAAWLTIYTFAPTILNPNNFVTSTVGNVLLFIAFALAALALQVWLLPVMVNARSQFMPGVYLHGVVGLLGNVGVPLILIWLVTYPLLFWVHGWDSTQFWVQCAQVTNIPGSCSFTPFTGYIICAIVFSIPFGLMMAGLYFWSTRRNMVVLGGTFGLVWVGLAVALIHFDTTDSTTTGQIPFGLMLAAGIVILAFVWTWATQREFAPTRAEKLGCTGQWLMLGTLLLIYLMGFSLLSMPSFFEIEALALFYTPGQGGLHDAFWGVLLMGGLAAFQLTLLIRRRKMSNLRKFAMWVMLAAIVLEVMGAIQGFHNDVLQTGVNGMEGSHALFVTGICFSVVGIVATLIGAIQARSIPWVIVIGVGVLIGAAVAVVFYAYSFTAPYPELVVLGFGLTLVGAFAYVAAGPDAEDEYALAVNGAYANGNGNGSYLGARQ